MLIEIAFFLRTYTLVSYSKLPSDAMCGMPCAASTGTAPATREPRPGGGRRSLCPARAPRPQVGRGPVQAVRTAERVRAGLGPWSPPTASALPRRDRAVGRGGGGRRASSRERRLTCDGVEWPTPDRTSIFRSVWGAKILFQTQSLVLGST